MQLTPVSGVNWKQMERNSMLTTDRYGCLKCRGDSFPTKWMFFFNVIDFWWSFYYTSFWYIHCWPQNALFPLIEVSPQFLRKGIFSLKPLILRYNFYHHLSIDVVNHLINFKSNHLHSAVFIPLSPASLSPSLFAAPAFIEVPTFSSLDGLSRDSQ